MNNKIRILFYYMRGIIDGGSDKSLYLHLVNLDKNKFEPIVLYRDDGEIIEKLKQHNIKVIKHKFFGRIHPKTHPKLYYSKIYNSTPGSKTILYFFRSLIEIILIINFILKYEIDILHLNHSINSDKTAAVSGIILKKRIFVHSRSENIKITKFDKFLVNQMEKIICISDYIKNQHILLKVNPSRCVTIYNGVDTSIYQNFKSTSMNLETTIGYVGRLEKWKGIHVLLRSMDIVLKQDENIKVLIVGDGSAKQYFKDLTKELNLTKNVTFLGKVSNIEKIYASLDILVHTSVEPEPFGRVVIEAMVFELPVISTNIGGPKEIITNGYDGFLVEPGNPEILARKILELLTDLSLRARIGNAASKTVKKKFDIKQTTKQIEKLYG